MDNRVVAFRDDQNLERINLSTQRLDMPEIPKKLWEEALHTVIADNLDYIPPGSSKGAL